MAKQRANSSHDEMTEANGSSLGRMAAISKNTNTNNLDWALIRLDRQDILSSVSRSSPFGYVETFVKSMPARANVQAITASSGILQGTIFGMPTFTQEPYSVAFQEMWTVRLDGPLSKYSPINLGFS